jgi:hypothetical protein
MPTTLDRPVTPDALAPDHLLIVLPEDPPAVTPEVARILLRMVRSALPELGGRGRDGQAA